jgi:hypothetical protein
MSQLPDRPDLDQLRRQARELLRAASAGDVHALSRISVVSERVTLSTAQLAVAREYGFPSWPALRTEAEHRRRMSGPALPRARRPASGDRFSFGGAHALEIAAGTLTPIALVVGPAHAALDAWLVPSAETQRRLGGPDRGRAPGTRFIAALAALAGQRPVHSEMPRFDDLAVVDDRGTSYTLSFESGSIPREEPGQVRGPIEMRLELDPVPPRDCGWLELHGQGGPAARLRPSAHPGVRVRQPAPTPGGTYEFSDRIVGPDVVERTDGPEYHLDFAADLPALGGTVLQLDTLIFRPGGWYLYLRARPGWRTSGDDRLAGQQDAISVHAEDELGGTYLSTFGGGTGHGDHDELALRFRPRLDPLARSLKLTCTGSSGDQVAVDVRLAPALRLSGHSSGSSTRQVVRAVPSGVAQ